MKKQIKNEDKNISTDTIAEQWVKLILTHIEANKKKGVGMPANKNRSQNPHEEYKIKLLQDKYG